MAQESQRLSDLKKLRILLWQSMREVPEDKRAPLAAQFRATVEEIEKLTPKEEAGDNIDEIAKRRNERRQSRSSVS